MYTLRVATPDDAALLARLDGAAATHAGPHGPGHGNGRREARLAGLLAGVCHQVVVVDGRDAGVVAVAHEPGCVVLADLRLLPAHRPLAAALLKELLRAAWRAGVPLALHVAAGPHAAHLRERYARWGFAPAGQTATGWLLSHDLGRAARRPGASGQPDGERGRPEPRALARRVG